ncbi:MAG: hypothetical protein IKP88_21095 [Lachnospiraceae bacterium]|nr:hypothetical protein [Lachnospiraceae bacterium]
MTEIDRNVLKGSEDKSGSKVEVVVKRDASKTSTEIDFLHIFVNMGRKKRIYAWVILMCMLIGFAAPIFISQISEKRESVSAMMTFTYPEAKDELTPDGEALDINYVSSSYILRNAVKKTKISKDIPISAIERNIKIERLLDESTRQNLEVVEKVITETKKDYEEVKNIEYQYNGKYIVTLSNGFSESPDGKNKEYLAGEEITALLNNIIESYNEYFYETYMNMELPDNSLDSISNKNLDYIERLDSIVDLLNTLSGYCTDEEKKDFFRYRSKLDGMSLADINDCIRLVRDIDVDYLYAYVYYNSITKDKKSMTTNYEYLLRDAQRELNIINGNIDNNTLLIREYKNDSITINNPEQGIGQVSSVTTDYYNQLVLMQADNYENKAGLSEKIANLNDKIDGFKTSTSSSEQTNFVENELDSLTDICNNLYNLTEKHAEEIINGESYKNSFISFIGAQYLGDSLLSATVIKKAVLGLVIGLVLAVFVWGMDGLVYEFKHGSENKTKSKAEVTEA